ncbi:DUF2927 domain-containing protein [Celeribacter litoreus]|uniref:DUF2927 domain-containing protein n=1 Tax=Celeribacter litoreus TaxID=2876714 RepID=UPI001CCEA858|nr:DUF2927 domain-containing protein [Celeribacter litoreus]MCA0043608.1 DUF2927 domain-containing protein [Celeribacter litoreus]
MTFFETARLSRLTRPLLAAALGYGLLAGCDDYSVARYDTAALPEAATELPPMKLFEEVAPPPLSRSNASLARDFLDLSFRLETGVELPQFSRFEGPITIRVTGDNIPVSLNHDLGLVLKRIESEADLSIRRVSSNRDASITIETLPKDRLARRAPNTACIVVPNVSSWQDFTKARRDTVSWTKVKTRERIAIFIPYDEAPQEIRDCLHEELAQALGPLNDLFRLPDSVFNDDNIHSVLTPFDMMILRATYDPALRSGMKKPEVAAALPGIFDRINPKGRYTSTPLAAPTPEAWQTAILTALGDSALSTRRQAASDAVRIATASDWQDTRTGFSWMLYGRLSVASDRAATYMALNRAHETFKSRPETRFHAAHVSMQQAALALSEGNYSRAYELAAEAIPAAKDAENAALLSSLLMTESTALLKLGRPAEARTLYLDSLGWARYGFGEDDEVRTRLSEIAALAR